MRAHRSGRARCVALAAAVSTVLTFGLSVVAFAEDSEDHGEPGLESLGFVHLQDLTLADGKQATSDDRANLNLIGAPEAGSMLLLAPYKNSLITLDTAASPIKQKSVQATPHTAGPIKSWALAAKQSRLFLGTAIAKGTIGCGEPVLCVSGPLAAAPQIVTMSLTGDPARLYQLPADFNATDVVGLTSATTAAGKSIVYALLYSDLAGYQGYQGAAGHILELVALDGDKLAAGSGDPLLWSYSIPSCTSLPYTSTNDRQDFLGVSPDGRAAYFVCRGSTAKSSTGNAVPAGAVVVDFDGELPTASSAPDAFRTTYYPQGAGTAFVISGGDETRGLAFLTSVATINKQYVFDVRHRAWTGSVPFPTSGDGNLWGSAPDASTGRDYVVYPRDFVIAVQDDQLPVPQGARLALGDLIPTALPPVVDPYTHTLFIAGSFKHRDKSDYPADDVIALYRDTRPVPEHVTDSHPDQLTHDEEITPDTPVSYGAFASSYGARATFVGGLHSTLLGFGNLSGGADPGYPLGLICNGSPDTRACFGSPKLSDDSRAIGFGVVDGVEASNTATKASAAAVELDAGSSADVDALGSYRVTADLWDKFGSKDEPPPATPGADTVTQPTQQSLAPAQCSDLEGKNKPAVSSNGATAVCHGAATQQASAAAVAPGQVDGLPIQVGYAASSTSVGRVDNVPVTIATAEARDVRIGIPGGPTIDIGRITSEATSAAGGRKGSAKSTYTRVVSNVTVSPPGGGDPYFSCGFAGAAGPAGAECDPRALTDAVSEQSPSPVQFLMPSPDTSPGVAGSPGGAQAEVIKDRYTFWNDYFANADAGYEVPALKVMLIGDQTQSSRLVFSLAGVHVESHQVIGALPPPPPEEPLPTLELTLVDGATPPVPLAGATFALQGAEGTEPQTCLTAADGIGTCTFEDLEPGDYTIQETAAPPGFAPVEDFVVTLEPGSDYKSTVVNLPAIGAVKVSLVSAGDEAKPLAGAEFAMFKGTDVLGTPTATCTTDDQGTCGFEKVPLGAYTMQQTSAPEGYLVSDSIAFSLKKPLEVAALSFVDGIPGTPPVPPTIIPGTPPVPPTIIPGKPAVPPRVIPGKPAVPPRTMVLPALDGATDAPALEPAAYETSGVPAPVVASQPSGTGPLGLGAGGLKAVSARLARLVIHSPQQAVLLLFVWLVLGLPVYLWVRRRQFITATEGI